MTGEHLSIISIFFKQLLRKFTNFLYVYYYIHIHSAPTYQGFGAFLFICLLLYTQSCVFNDHIAVCSCYSVKVIKITTKKELTKMNIYTKKQAAEFLQISRPQLDVLINTGYLIPSKLGKRTYRITEQQLMDCIELGQREQNTDFAPTFR